MEYWFDNTSEDDPFVGFEDPLSYTWLDTSGDPLYWATQYEDLVMTGHSSTLQPSPRTTSNPEAVETWLQRTESSSQLSDRTGTLEDSTDATDQDAISRNTSNSSLQSMASSAQSFTRRGRRLKNGYPCGKCGDTFDVPSELRHHEKKHMPSEERPFGCTGCRQRFIWPKDLKRHIRRKHPGLSDDLENLSSGSLSRHASDNAVPGLRGADAQIETRIGQFDQSSFDPEDGLMLPRKKRKALLVLDDANIAQSSADQQLSTDNNKSAAPLLQKSAETSNTELLEDHSSVQHGSLMDRKQRTKAWLEATKTLFRAAKDIPRPLLDIFLHSLDTMAREIDRLQVEEADILIDKNEARAALAVVVEYFKQPGEGLPLPDGETLSRLVSRLAI